MLRTSTSAVAAAALVGCGSSSQTRLPGVPWPALSSRPEGAGPAESPAASPGYPPQPGQIVPRSQWTGSGAITGRVNPMNGVRRITMHHEGATDSPVYFSDMRTTAARIEQVHRAHLNRGWGDIGYHYIIDRAGRIWEARSLRYQGAHVRDNNEHNIGVMCLGNFDIQQPSAAQVEALTRFVAQLRHRHGVSIGRLHTHQEIVPTRCPGVNLQPRIASLRSRGAFA